ncbi:MULTISPECIES: hypothetical protein [unclassified Sinorhizobium]|uniref:hypothetical protein n=1 Tax=unclassified Sinorhizobium TaxID=2613772 RepID=UPI0024C4437B|nr:MULTISPECIES: hypothetical protein [unclassified Sinorhizobium]MDK1373561.1 hypothetical protein [Sinorhizobium sp. 6-70]MDK1480171.1 hypothetical protein [Sinorhizobium sp. 6-117]
MPQRACAAQHQDCSLRCGHRRSYRFANRAFWRDRRTGYKEEVGGGRLPMSRSQNAFVYLFLLIAQSVAAFLLLWLVFPIFYNLVTNLGQEQDIAPSTQISVIAGAIVLQACYWARLHWVDVKAPFHNIFVAHLLFFVGRLSFLFGGAFFSAIFFRHLPELAVFPPFGQALIKALGVGAVLFGLFCYSLELDRLGKAIEGPPRGSPPD